MKLRKIVAGGLAACFLFQYVPPVLWAQAAEPTSAALSFAGSSSTEVVEGGSATINIEKPTYYVEDSTKNGLNITPSTNANMVDTTKISVQGETNASVKTIAIADKFFTAAAQAEALGPMATLDIEGAYYALVTSGNVVEKGGGQKTTAASASTFQILGGQELRVFQASSIVLKCDSTENENTLPTFSISGAPTGDAFTNFGNVYVTNQGPRTDPTKPLTIAMEIKSGVADAGKRIEFSINTQTVYEKTEDGTADLTPPNRYVQKDATFTLTVPQPTSNKAFLTVYSPKRACNNVKAEIETQAQPSYQGEQKYIKLAEDEDIGFIRQDFDLNYSTSKYNETFYIDWHWEATAADNPGVTGDLSKVVEFPDASSGFQTVKLNRLYDDVKGTLVGEIHCRDRDSEVYKDSNTGTVVQGPGVARIKVTIKGLGTPASLTKLNKREMTQNADGSREAKVVPYTGNDTTFKAGETLTLNAYDGHIGGTKIPKEPFQQTIQLNMGLASSKSMYAVVECISGDPSIVTLQTQTSTSTGELTSDYAFGAQIENPNAGAVSAAEGSVKLVFNPAKTGERNAQTIGVRVTYYVANTQGRPVKAVSQPEDFYISVKDSSPNDDAKLGSLEMQRHKQPSSLLELLGSWLDVGSGEGFSFDPTTYQYQLSMPYKYDKVRFKPTRSDIYYGGETIYVRATVDGNAVAGWELNSGSFPPGYDGELTDVPFHKVSSGSVTPEIPLTENKNVKVEFYSVAEDQTTQSYIVDVMRKPMGTDPSLKSFILTDEDGNELFNGIVRNQFVYNISVPYKVEQAKVSYELNDPEAPALDPDKSFTPPLERNSVNPLSTKEWVSIRKHCENDSGGWRTMTMTVHTLAEDGVTGTEYQFNIIRQDPSNVNTLDKLRVLDAKNGNEEIELSPPFHVEMAEGDYYEVSIPYRASSIRIAAETSDTGATAFLAHGWEEDIPAAKYEAIPRNTPSAAFTPPVYREQQDGTPIGYVAMVEVWPESVPASDHEQYRGDTETYKQKVLKYPIYIYREPPSEENRLKTLTITDQNDAAVSFSEFESDITRYNLSVPYEVEKVRLTPTALDENVSKILVNGRKVSSGSPSTLIPLGKAREPKTINVVVTPEAGSPERTYQIVITRQDPSSDARLIKLEVSDATDFGPVFAPSRLAYTANVAKGAEGVRVTATTNNPGARIDIDGVRVDSGVPSELIRILTEKQTVNVVVTAQDGVTKMTYKITLTNVNLIIKTNNADLKSLEVLPGVMRPVDFSSAVTDYDVSVDEEAYSVRLIPEAADEYAKVEVLQGTRQIGDQRNNYAAALEDGENEFSIVVTAPDESRTKVYTVTVFRNDEEEMGTLKPVTAEEIDWEDGSNPIIVDIRKYARISSEVFTTLKEDYPEKTIIFQGNDYSMQFEGDDLFDNIPYGEVYDFKMSFTSPLEDEVYEEIYSHDGNEDTDFVLVHFGYHGGLPGPALLSLSLGQQYKNEILHWNYYNEERERVDYYGTVRTNTRGTFNLTMDHLSTYIISDERIVGAENKAGMLLNTIYNPNGTIRPSGILNPDTGVGGRP